MPFVSVRITREPKNTPEAKAEIIRQMTDVLVNVLGKDPDTTFVVIEEIEVEDWGVGGLPAPVWREKRKSRGS